MKINGVNHAKVHQLADWLQAETSIAYNLCHSMAAGMIERLIDFAHHSTPRGDIGRIPNRVIARTLGWEGDAERFVAELVTIRWFDHHPEHRLLIHDWSHHAMEATKVSLIRRGETTFADGKPIRSPQDDDGGAKPQKRSRDSVATASQQSERSSASASASASASTQTEAEEEASAAAAAPPHAALVAAAPPEPEPEPAPPRKPPKQRGLPLEAAEPPEAIRFAEDFAAGVVGANERARMPSQAAMRGWAREARLMLERDLRPLAEAQALAEWLLNSDHKDAVFWRPNVMCMESFRRQYARLDALRRRSNVRPIRQPRPGSIEDAVRNISADIDREFGRRSG